MILYILAIVGLPGFIVGAILGRLAQRRAGRTRWQALIVPAGLLVAGIGWASIEAERSAGAPAKFTAAAFAAAGAVNALAAYYGFGAFREVTDGRAP
jgi:hypothetical protein